MKWSKYELKIDESLLYNIQKFVPVDGSNKTNTKSYRLKKKGLSTGVFNEKSNQNPNLNIYGSQNNEIDGSNE